MNQVQIIPSILAYSVNEFKEKLLRVEGIVDRVQIDIVGKAFCKEPTVGIEVLEQVSLSMALDIQLMVREPITFVNRCDLGGAERVYGHVEYMKNEEEFVEYVATLGMQVGLAVDLETEVSEINIAFDVLDSLLLMAVPAGKSGQKFDKSVINKIREVRKLNSMIPICVDGGINENNIKSCFEAGANEFAVGNYLWESKDITATINNLVNIVS